MKREVIITAKTVEEAMSQAYATYGSEGDVACEILEMPKKGFLGIGGTPAKIKAIIDDGEDDIDISSIIGDLKAKKIETDKGGDGSSHSDEKKEEKKPEKKPAPVKAEPKAEKPVQKKEAPAKKETPAPAKKVEAPAPVKAEAPAKEETAPKKVLSDSEKKQKYQPVSDIEMQFAVEFVETVLRDLEIEAKTVTVKDEDGDFVGINIVGDSTGTLIGHHGETLDAIQYLANLSASRRSPTPNREFLKITVDIENYRAKREETLRSLARRMAAKAVKYKRNFVLEPMNPYERRIIHSEIQMIDDVDTHSVGSDENRKVVVTYEGADKVERRSRGRRRRPNYNAGPVNAENDPMAPQSYGSVGEDSEGN